MLYDDILHHIGDFGLYQKLIFFLTSLGVVLAAMNVVSQVFLAGNADHWCDIVEWKNCDCSLDENYPVSICDELKKNLSIPLNDLGEFLQCSKYVFPPKFEEQCPDFFSLEDLNLTIYESCDGHWVYDRSRYKTSIISDFNLVCERQSFPNMAQSVYFAGILVGSISFGTICDKFGRRFGLFSATVATGIFGSLVAVSSEFWMYMIFRFFLGASAHNANWGAFLIVTELVGSSKRGLAGLAMNVVFAIGVIIVAVIAYFIRSWRLLQFIITFPGFISLILLPVIPESPRWLYSKKKSRKAVSIIKRAAQFNGVELSETLLRECDSEVELSQNQTDGKFSPLELFRLPAIRQRSLILLYTWFTVSLVYYGLVLSTESLGVNIYLGFLISGSVEIFGYIFSVVLLDWFGRKITVGGLLLLAGLTCFLAAIAPLGIARIVIGMIGKCAISAAFGCTCIFTAELYPTLLRGMAMGTCSLTSWVGGILCPFILILAKTWAPLPLVLFSAASIIAGALITLLPETKGTNLPETMVEAEQLSKRQRRKKTVDKDERF